MVQKCPLFVNVYTEKEVSVYHRKCQHRGIGGQEKPKSCQRSLWTTPNDKKAWLFNVHISTYICISDANLLPVLKICRSFVIPMYLSVSQFQKSFGFFFETWNIYAWTSQTDFTLVLTSPSPFRSLLLRDMISLSCAKSCSSKSTLRSLFNSASWISWRIFAKWQKKGRN